MSEIILHRVMWVPPDAEEIDIYTASLPRLRRAWDETLNVLCAHNPIATADFSCRVCKIPWPCKPNLDLHVQMERLGNQIAAHEREASASKSRNRGRF